jgi:2-keto-3-deoxy-6-phosphogluconate aldolase
VSAELVVASVEVAGEVVIITLEAGLESAEQIIIHASAAGEASAALVAGTVITASAVTIASAAGASLLLGHILLHGAEVLLFIPHGDLTVGLHSHML